MPLALLRAALHRGKHRAPSGPAGSRPRRSTGQPRLECMVSSTAMHHLPRLPVEDETIRCAHLPLLLLSDNLALHSRHHVATIRVIHGYDYRCTTFTCHLTFLFAYLSCPSGAKPRLRSFSFSTRHCLYPVYIDSGKMLLGATHVYKLTLLLVKGIISRIQPMF